MLNFKCMRPIKTVYTVLQEHGRLDLLQDELIEHATMEIVDEGQRRREVQAAIKRKEKAIEILARKYAGNGLDSELVRQCLYSIGDNNSFLR